MPNGTYRDQTICLGDDDWYRLELGRTEELILDLGYEASEGNVDLFLFDATGTEVIAEARSTRDDEHLVLDVAQSGTYLLRVTLADDRGESHGNAYDLGVVSIVQSACSPDAFEPNDTPGQAPQLAGGTFSGLTICPGEPDHYLLPMGVLRSSTLRLVPDQPGGGLSVALLDGRGARVAVTEQTSDGLTLKHRPSDGEGRVLEVVLASGVGVSAMNYSMVLDVAEDAGEEPGGEADGASSDRGQQGEPSVRIESLPHASHGHWLWAPGEQDRYVLTGLVAGSLLRVQFGSDPEAGDLDLELFDPLGRRVASGSNGAGPERLSAVTRMHGDFELVATRVGQGGPPTAYEVEVEVDPVGSDCASDALEPRGAGGGERLLGPGAWERLSVCPGVDDVYVVSASAGEPLEVRLDFAHDEGNVDLLLLDPSGRQLASSTSRSDDESISWLADRTGLHVLRVVLEEDSGAMPGNVYALDLGPLPSRTCPAEHFEPNDTFTSGTRLIDGLYPGLAVCFREPDYYRLNSAIPGPLEVDVSFEPDGGQVVVRLLDEDGSVLVEASRAPDGAKLRYQTTRRGPYFLEVTLAVDTGVGTGRQYELDVQVPDEDG